MAAKNDIPLVKGMREFYPEDMAVRSFLYDTARKVSQRFGYQEWDAPFLETLELYAAKSGEELVEKQSFVFHDRGNERVTLRPEATPSLARMIAKRQQELVFPLRWFQWGPMWRYEQPQKGRSREFFQWNADILGPDSPEADAELIAVAATFLKEVGLGPDRALIYVNNRRLMDAQFEKLGIPQESRLTVSALVDRRPKMQAEAWDAYALEQGLGQTQLDGLKALLGDKDLWKQSEELVRLFKALDAFGVGDYVRFDSNIMRGILYYTGTVFEAFDVTGSLRRAILGGGRYDKLLADVGGQPLSGAGFAMGDVVIGLILAEQNLLPVQSPSPAQVLVAVFDDASEASSFAISGTLRAAGINTLNWQGSAKLAKQFKFADRMGVKIVVLQGPDEAARGEVTVKNLSAGTQECVPLQQLAAAVHKLLSA